MNVRNAPTSVALLLIASAVAAARAAEEGNPVQKAQENGVGLVDLPALVSGNTAFGLDLYSQLRHTPGNAFFSPFSVSTALAMTATGARGETARQMEKVLHFPFGADRLEPAFASLIR